jgi:hypothetical protein
LLVVKALGGAGGVLPAGPIDTVEIMEDTLAGKYVVCRICEGVIQEESLAAHTALCRYASLASPRLCALI